MRSFVYRLCTAFALLVCVSCVQQTGGMRDAAERQIASSFFAPLAPTARFIVRLQPPGATRLVRGERVPIRLHEALQSVLERDDLLFQEKEKDPGIKYALVVEKRDIRKAESEFSQSFSDTLEKLQMGEGSYMVEVSVEEIVKNEKGEELFGRRLALFSTPLHRSEDDIASDIVREIEEHMH
ncbi:MAG: hypothetical protein IJU76_05220 [Desulfovibrionaceae bacterium]|nr:hypothetical protein [Desulfovibrionaceae bacterium]